MEIKDPVHGTVDFSPAEVKILDTPVYQRLRTIKQLGFAEYSFPGATHNRYLHSLGVCHLAGIAFDNIFQDFPFSNPETKHRLRQCVRLGALLHDIGHGPLSHTTEEVMPLRSELDVKIYKQRKPKRQSSVFGDRSEPKAKHEDYTIKFLTDSSLTEALCANFPDFAPEHVAYLIDNSLECPDDFFIDQGWNFRPILSQIISSEMDVDRMDYLERDSYYCGTNYGRVELNWLLSNLAYHQSDSSGDVHLALNRRALYTFDDFLISRHHMYLMVYFHHKSIIYEEMLHRYLMSPDCTYVLPSDINEYIKCTDYSIYEHMSSVSNPWARRINERRPYKVLFELHATEESPRPQLMQRALEEAGIDLILASSQARLSKYHTMAPEEKAHQIFVVDGYDPKEKPVPIEDCTEIFQKYEDARRIERIYVAPEQYEEARKVVAAKRL